VTAQLPASVALVTTSKWRSERGEARSTLVAKLTMQLGDANRAALLSPEPFVAFDRISPDGRHVTEVGEMAPWTTVASIIAYGGPLRFTLEDEKGAPLMVATASAKSPAGYSMSSPERVAFAKRTPSRGADAVLAIPDDLDGRYFVAAPKTHQLPSIRGDERFLIELAGWRCHRRLAGALVVVTIELRGRMRAVVLTPDLVTVNGLSRRISIVSRALVHGDVSIVGHEVFPRGAVTIADHGDSRDAEAEETCVLSDQEMGSLRALHEETSDAGTASLFSPTLAAPFELEPPSVDGSERARIPHAAVPATPFDKGFVPAPVMPGVGVLRTLTADEEMAEKLKALRNQLRSEGIPTAPRAAEPRAPIAESNEAKVAPPRPGAMAKPRLKKK
jgi:hypothetical protein